MRYDVKVPEPKEDEAFITCRTCNTIDIHPIMKLRELLPKFKALQKAFKRQLEDLGKKEAKLEIWSTKYKRLKDWFKKQLKKLDTRNKELNDDYTLMQRAYQNTRKKLFKVINEVGIDNISFEVFPEPDTLDEEINKIIAKRQKKQQKEQGNIIVESPKIEVKIDAKSIEEYERKMYENGGN